MLVSKLRTLRDYMLMSITLGGDFQTMFKLASCLPRIKLSHFTKSYTQTASLYKIRFNQQLYTLYLRCVDVFILKELLYEKCYRSAESIRKPPDVIIDLGAHIGLASLYFHTLFPTVSIHAYEPVNENYELLKKNVAAFQAIVPHQVAVGEPGIDTIYVLPENPAGNSIVHSSKTMHGIPQKCEVRSLDDILARHATKNLLVKFDIEGMEHAVFGNSQAIHTVEYIIGETKCTPETLDRLKAMFPHHTFESQRITPNMYLVFLEKKRI